MSVAPDVQLSGKLDVLLVGASGTPVAAPDTGSIEVALCGYGSQVPRVAGEAMLSLVTQAQEVNTDDPIGEFEINLFSNSVIQPQGTYYTITIKDDNGDIVQTEAFIFAPGTYDLTTLTPFDPSLGPVPSPIPPAIVNQLQLVNVDGAGNYNGDGAHYLSFQLNVTQDGTIQINNGLPGNLYTFIIVQDSIGGHNLVWASNFVNATPVNPDPNGRTVQTFVMAEDGTLYPIGAGTWQ